MPVFLQPYMRGIIVGLGALFGIALGFAVATGLGRTLAPAATKPQTLVPRNTTASKQASLQDYEIILRRNLFNSSAPGTLGKTSPETSETPVARSTQKLTLLGTVNAGKQSLALIEAGKESALYRGKELLPDGGRLDSILRNQVRIQYPDGSSQTLSMETAPLPDSRPSANQQNQAPGTYQVREVSENSWAIPASEMERARENMSQLLKQARLEPHVVDGQTDGFMVRMIKPGTLLGQLGLRLGDIITSVNGVSLDSPEKALQIFQQLREARRLTVSLIREGNPVNFEYEVD